MSVFKTRNEKRLALLLAAALVGVGGIAITSALLNARAHLVTEVRALEDERQQAKTLLEDRVLWQKRAQWLDATQPQLVDAGQESAALLSEIESAAQKSGMEVKSKVIGEAERGPYFVGLPVRIQATGDIRSLAAWLLKFQQPSNFYMVRALTIKAAEKQGLVDCGVEFVRCYVPAKPNMARR